MKASTLRPPRVQAFTLVEIMIVGVIIGVLAALALPAIQKAQRSARQNRFISDLRVFAQSFEQYALEQGAWPANAGAGVIPANMTTALHRVAWTGFNSLGGRWNYDRNLNGFSVAISTTNVTVDDTQMTAIDAKIDDGDLGTGLFQKAAGRYSYVLEQ